MRVPPPEHVLRARKRSSLRTAIALMRRMTTYRIVPRVNAILVGYSSVARWVRNMGTTASRIQEEGIGVCGSRVSLGLSHPATRHADTTRRGNSRQRRFSWRQSDCPDICLGQVWSVTLAAVLGSGHLVSQHADRPPCIAPWYAVSGYR